MEESRVIVGLGDERVSGGLGSQGAGLWARGKTDRRWDGREVYGRKGGWANGKGVLGVSGAMCGLRSWIVGGGVIDVKIFRMWDVGALN